MFELLLILVLVGVGLYFLPRLITLDSTIWTLIRVLVIIATIVYVYQHRAVLGL